LFAGVPRDVVVIDTGNYYPRQRDGRIAEIEEGMTESRWVEHQLGRPVVKAFNNIYAQHLMDLGRPAGGLRIALPVAGDDAYAKAVVLHLVEELGPGGNSPAHPCTPPISMPRACGARSPRQATSGHRSGEPRRTAPAISRVPPDGGAML
jgi:hypothetical protein